MKTMMKTNKQNRSAWIALALMPALLVVGCDGGASNDSNDDVHDETPVQTNRVDIPAAVRSNLGISFAKVESRQVEQTLRVPGRFEYLPSAKREYRTPMPGRVELVVDQFERVEVGAVLYRIDSPGWRGLQQQLMDAIAQIDHLQAQIDSFGPLLEAHAEHEKSLAQSAEVWVQRVKTLEQLREAGGGRIDELSEARSMLASTRAEFAIVLEKDAELLAQTKQVQAQMRGTQSRLSYLLDTAAAVTSLDRDTLVATTEVAGRTLPRWAAINRIDVRADIAGVVAELGLTNGAWADEKSAVLTIVQPDRLRFRASGLQSDLGALRDGLSARIVSPTATATGRSVAINDVMQGKLMLGLEGDPDDRTIELFVVPESLSDWARPGVSAQLEIVTDGSANSELAIPLAAVLRDGLTPVIFRRAPDNPDQVIRMEADLGMNDGRWVEVLSGVAAGDEIVVNGAFQLMLSTSGSIQKGGHFHSDGTFHEGED